MTRVLLVATLLAAIGMAVPTASADISPISPVMFEFRRVSESSVVDVSSQLTMTVFDGGSYVGFIFRNDGPLVSSICDIYFEQGAGGTSGGPLTGVLDLVGNGDAVKFSVGARPRNLPEGNNVDFTATANLSADSDCPVQLNGIGPGESLLIAFEANQSFDYVISSLLVGLGGAPEGWPEGWLNGFTGPSLRIGLHVQAIDGTGQSTSHIDHFISSWGSPQPQVPAPAAILLGAIGLGLVAWGGRRPA